MVSFELYPWHSPSITAPLGGKDAQEFIQKYIWEPMVELGAPVFAFGKPWFSILKELPDLDVVKQLGYGRQPYGSRVKSRSVIVLQGSGGLTVIAEKHLGARVHQAVTRRNGCAMNSATSVAETHFCTELGVHGLSSRQRTAGCHCFRNEGLGTAATRFSPAKHA